MLSKDRIHSRNGNVSLENPHLPETVWCFYTTYKLFDLGQITQLLSTSVFLSHKGVIYLIGLIPGLKEFLSVKCFKNSAWHIANAKDIYYITAIPVLGEKALKL